MAFKKGISSWNRGKRIIDTCPICRKDFYPTDNKWRQRRKTCSDKCKWKMIARANKGNKAWNKGLKLTKEHIEKLRVATTKAWAEGKHKNNPTSSGYPNNKGKKMPQLTGKNNGNYKNGLYPLTMKIRRSDKYKEWRNNVFQEAFFICDNCEQVGGKLIAHHIKEFSKLLVENKITDYHKALECRALWDLNNGKTLCVTCHKQAHKGGGAVPC